MDTATVAARLVELCSQFKNFEAMQELYADDIVSVEASPRPNGSLETKGKEAVIGKSKDWAAAHEIHGAAIHGPFLLQDRFAVTFQFDVTPKATGTRASNEEIAVYTVAGGKITREEFFYGVNANALAR
ncbi:MAG: nuclear transport factor 2 family protein [Bryobacterales bacterium]|nr:nuclear transport factor 2 family protein [Bryobacterales bacterium]